MECKQINESTYMYCKNGVHVCAHKRSENVVKRKIKKAYSGFPHEHFFIH